MKRLLFSACALAAACFLLEPMADAAGGQSHASGGSAHSFAGGRGGSHGGRGPGNNGRWSGRGDGRWSGRGDGRWSGRGDGHWRGGGRYWHNRFYPGWVGFGGYGYPYYSGYYPYDYPFAYYGDTPYYGYNDYGYNDDSPVRAGSAEAAVQSALARRGYYRGEVDGILGPATYRAIRAFQADKGLPVTGQVDDRLLRALRIG